ncbi:ABC transporter ATP-binding protein, partial [Listeria monocytogenes]|nr:ABC transporter ATP-binding protein [Listeria monocytogenes]
PLCLPYETCNGCEIGKELDSSAK